MLRTGSLVVFLLLLAACSAPRHEATAIDPLNNRPLVEAPDDATSGALTPDPVPAAPPGREELERLAWDLFLTFLGEAHVAPEDVFLSEAEVRRFYNPAFAKIVLPSWSTQNTSAWEHFTNELEGTKAGLERIEVDEPVFYRVDDGRPGATLVRDAHVIHEVRVTYNLDGVQQTLVLKTCLHTRRGWRALQLEPGT